MTITNYSKDDYNFKVDWDKNSSMAFNMSFDFVISVDKAEIVIEFENKNFINSQCKYLQNVRIETFLEDYIYQTEFEKGFVRVLKGLLAAFSTSL